MEIESCVLDRLLIAIVPHIYLGRHATPLFTTCCVPTQITAAKNERMRLVVVTESGR